MIRFLLIFISLLIPTNILAETFCEALSSEIKSRQITDRLDLPPLNFNGYNSLGINFDDYHNYNDDTYTIKRDQDGNPVVFNIQLENGDGIKFEAAKYLKYGDRIISINNHLLKDLNFEQIYEIIYNVQQEDLDEGNLRKNC